MKLTPAAGDLDDELDGRRRALVYSQGTMLGTQSSLTTIARITSRLDLSPVIPYHARSHGRARLG